MQLECVFTSTPLFDQWLAVIYFCDRQRQLMGGEGNVNQRAWACTRTEQVPSSRDCWQLMGFHEYISAKSIMQLNGSIESIYGQAQTRSKNDASANRLSHLYHWLPLFCNVYPGSKLRPERIPTLIPTLRYYSNLHYTMCDGHPH